MTSSTPLASITSYYVPLGSQVTSWMHLQTFSCLWKSTAWLSLGHFKPRMPIMNSSSFSQQPYSPLTFSISMKGRVSTKQRKAKPLEVVVDWNWSFSCQIHLLDSHFDRLLSSFFFSFSWERWQPPNWSSCLQYYPLLYSSTDKQNNLSNLMSMIPQSFSHKNLSPSLPHNLVLSRHSHSYGFTPAREVVMWFNSSV